jgi:hypothetical protein
LQGVVAVEVLVVEMVLLVEVVEVTALPQELLVAVRLLKQV